MRKFTAGLRQAFLDMSAAGHSPTRAALEIGISRQSLYRRRADDPAFAEAWNEALEQQA